MANELSTHGNRVRQEDRDSVADGNAVVGEMPGKLAGAFEKPGIGHRSLRVTIGALAAACHRVPAQ